MADAKLERWKAFTERERGLVAVSFVTYLLATITDEDADPADNVAKALEVGELMSQLNESMGNPPVDSELMQRLADRAREIEAHHQPGI